MKRIAIIFGVLLAFAGRAVAAEPTADEIFDAFAARYERVHAAFDAQADPMFRELTYCGEGSLFVWRASGRAVMDLFTTPEKHFCEPAAVPDQWICTFVLPWIRKDGIEEPGTDQGILEILAEGQRSEIPFQLVMIPDGGTFPAPDVFIIEQPTGLRHFQWGALTCQGVNQPTGRLSGARTIG